MTVKPAFGILAYACLALTAPSGAAGQIFLPAACDIKPDNKHVNSGMLYLKSAFTTKFADQRAKDLKDADREFTQALTSDGQEKNPAAWYYLGRYYLMANDLPGADSALTKALALAPRCKDDILLYRRQAWVPVFNAGVQAWQGGNTDSAIASFRRANQIYQAEPLGFIYIANLFLGAGQTDSAVKYFRLAVPAASDPKYVKDRRDALFNVARVYHSAKRWDEAEAAYQAYLEAYPNDVVAMGSLGGLYMRGGKRDAALPLYDRIVALADSADADDLFAAAQVVLSAIPEAPDTAAAGADCRTAERKKTPAVPTRQIAARCHPAQADTMRKFHTLVDPQYRAAARAYEAGLAKDPYYRDALYNLAGISYLVGDTSKVLPLAQRLYALDPMNRLTLAKIAGGWQLLGNKDSVLYYLQVADSLPVEITVNSFSVKDSTATVEGLVTDFRSQPSVPVHVTFDFLNAKGEAVTSQPLDVPALAPAANHPFQLKAQGAGITAWRYKRS